MSGFSDIKGFFKRNWFKIIISIYLLSRIINLMSLPIFNDEAIWIDWGNKLKLGLVPLFYSLYDGKPPLHFVFISIFMIFIKNPLLAGRLVSVLAGVFSLIAIKNISKLFFEEKYVILSCLIYLISPMFLFYDRQALQESILTAEICWIIYFSIKYFDSLKLKYALYLSLTLALSFYTKISILIIFIPIFILFLYNIVKEKEKRNIIFSGISVVIFVFILLISPLILQEQSKLMFTRNDRYSITLNDLNQGIFNIWFLNVSKITRIIFWYFNILIFFISVTLILFYKKHLENKYFIFIIFSLPIIILIVISRGILERYLVPFTIPLIFISAKGIEYILVRYGKLVLLLLFIPITISLYQIFYIDNYLSSVNLYAKGLDLYGYSGGFTAGYGVREAILYIESLEKDYKKIIVGVRVDAGNPESAVMAYFLEDKNARVVPVYFDSQVTKIPLDENFIGNYYPFYFISREDNLAGMNKYLTEEKRFYQPDGKSFVGIYKYIKQ